MLGSSIELWEGAQRAQDEAKRGRWGSAIRELRPFQTAWFKDDRASELLQDAIILLDDAAYSDDHEDHEAAHRVLDALAEYAMGFSR